MASLVYSYFAFDKYFGLNSWIFFALLFKDFGTLVYIFKFIFSILWFVPMLCSLLLVVNVMHFFKYITLVPLLDFISLMQLPYVVVSVECWTCKLYFALSLLACMSGCSFLVWMIIVVTIYSDCSFLVKPCFIDSFLFAWLYCACSICILSFLLTMIVLCCCFQEILLCMV